jgi:hypothetical protein
VSQDDVTWHNHGGETKMSVLPAKSTVDKNQRQFQSHLAGYWQSPGQLKAMSACSAKEYVHFPGFGFNNI